jgi:iron complex outermembrane receptor protein
MRYLLILLLQISFLSLKAQNQHVLLKGIVFDIQTEKPLSDVQIINRNTIEAVTDLNGYFQCLCDTGTVNFSFILLGYQTFTKSIFLQVNTSPEITIGLEPVINELNEVVVSADKTEKLLTELSVSMNIIKPFDVTKNHIVNAEEIIKQTQGIEVIDGQASIRGGSGFSYGAGSRVLALINGLPAISADAGNIRWQFLPLENLAQIEIIKGASSVLYGSSALNGIINFISTDADTVPQIKYSISSGIFDKPTRKEMVWWKSPRMYSDASFSYSQRIRNTDINAALNVMLDNGYRKLNEETLYRANLSVKQYNPKIKGFYYGAGVLAGYNSKTDFILWENSKTGALIQNESTATLLNAIFLTFDPFITYSKNDIITHDLRMRVQISDNQYPENNSNNSKAVSNFAEYRFTGKFIERLDVIFGVSNFLSQITSQFYGNHKGDNISGYTQLEYKMFKKMRVSAGVRLEYNALDGITDKIVPIFRSGINYKLGRAMFLRASFGQGYRYPSIAEKFAYTSLGSVKIFPNSEVRSEFGWSSELGLKQGIKLKQYIGQFDIAFFYSENTDMIEYVFGFYTDPNTQEFDLGFRSSNIENSNIYGAETEFLLKRTLKKKLHFNFGGGYTYIYPVESNDNESGNADIYLKYRRKHTAKWVINVNYKKFECRVNVFYKSKVLNIDYVFINPLTRESLLPGFYDYWLNDNNGYVLADAYLSYQILKTINLSVGIKNMGNKEYMDRPGNIMPQRFYSLQLSGRF